MSPSGADRTLCMEYQNGLVDLQMAASDEFVYFLSSEVDPATQSSVKCLYQARLSDGTLLCDYASAGNRFSMDNRLTVWMKRK